MRKLCNEFGATVANRMYWHGPTNVTYHATKWDQLLVIVGDNGETYADAGEWE